MRMKNYVITYRVKRIIFYILLFSCFNCYSQISFVKQWFSIGSNGFGHFIELPDSTFLLGGTQSPNGSWGNGIIMRCNSNGDSLYALKYDSSSMGNMILLNDSEIVETGLITNPYSINFAKINFITGDTSYQKNLNISLVMRHLFRCTDNGFIMVNYNGGLYTFIKVDSNYNIQWNQPGWNMSYGARQIKPDPLGGYVAVGNGGYVSNPYVVEKFDSAGNVEWHYSYGNIPFGSFGSNFGATDVVISDDSNYIVGCKPGITFLKLNRLNGDTIWTKSFLFPIVKSVTLLNNAGNDTYITVTDSFGLINGNGDFIWQTPIVPQDFRISHGAKTLDGGYAFCGSTSNYQTAVFVKLDSLGNTVNTALYDIEKQKQIYFYPNPASDVLNFAPQHSTGNSFIFSIYNLFGNKVSTVINKTSIDVSGLTPGVYVAEVREGEKVTREKFVKE